MPISSNPISISTRSVPIEGHRQIDPVPSWQPGRAGFAESKKIEDGRSAILDAFRFAERGLEQIPEILVVHFVVILDFLRFDERAE